MHNSIFHPSISSIKKLHSSGSNSEDVFNQNRRLVLKIINDFSPITRKSLVEKTGLRNATITLIMNELLEAGIVEEKGFIPGDSGRKIMGFGMTSDKFCTVVGRLSISYLSVGVFDIHGKNLYINKIFMDTLLDIKTTCNVFIKEFHKTQSSVGDRTILGVGLGVEGPFIIRDGYYKLPHPGSENGLFDIGKELSDRLDYPVIINKQNNFAVYDHWKKRNKNGNLGTYINITVSYTIECGIIINGEILNGLDGSTGFLGNLLMDIDDSGQIHTLNDLCSSISIMNQVKELIKDYPDSVLNQSINNLNIRDVIRAFHTKDPLALNIFKEAGIYLGRAVATLVNILNPDFICIGDEIPTSMKMREIISNEAIKHISRHVNLNLYTVILDYESHRHPEIDPSLSGANQYIVDMIISSLDFSTADNPFISEH